MRPATVSTSSMRPGCSRFLVATFEAATDLGAGWWQQARKILIPLAAPGIFVAMILVYIPMLTDFVTSDLVGGTSSGTARGWNLPP